MENKYIKRINDYKKCLKTFDCADYIFIDEIKSFEFKRISGYLKSKPIYDKIVNDLNLVKELIEKKDVLNAAVILRTTYENIIYIIATSFDTEIKISLSTSACDLRNVLEKNCDKIFTYFFQPSDFNDLYYRPLSKLVHATSLKEIMAYFNKSMKYRDYILANLKYIMLVIEYMYLCFLNKKVGNQESKLDLNLIDYCSFANFININYFLCDIKDKQNLKKYFCYDLNNKYFISNQEKVIKEFNTINENKEEFERIIKKITNELIIQISESKYKDVLADIINSK